MREIIRKKQFKKDFQAIQRAERNLDRFVEAVTMLRQGRTLPTHFRDFLSSETRNCIATPAANKEEFCGK